MGTTVDAATDETLMTLDSRIATLERNHLALTVAQDDVRKKLDSRPLEVKASKRSLTSNLVSKVIN